MAARKARRGGLLSTRRSVISASSRPLASPAPNRQVDSVGTHILEWFSLVSAVHDREDGQGGERDDVRHGVRDAQSAVGGYSDQHGEDSGSRAVSHSTPPWSVSQPLFLLSSICTFGQGVVLVR